MTDLPESPQISGLQEHGTRTARFDVTGVPDMQASYSDQIFRPDHVILSYGWTGPTGSLPARGWHLLSAHVSGPRRLSDGRPGKERRTATPDRKSMPAWLDQLVGRFQPTGDPADA